MNAANSNDSAKQRSGSAAATSLPPFFARSAKQSVKRVTNTQVKLSQSAAAATPTAAAASAVAAAVGKPSAASAVAAAVSAPAVGKPAAASAVSAAVGKPSAASAAAVSAPAVGKPAAASTVAAAVGKPAAAAASAVFAPAVGKPAAQSPSQMCAKKMAAKPKQRVNKVSSKITADPKAAPLELFVVGHQVNMHPWHNTVPMALPPAAKLTTAPLRTAARPKNVNLNLLSQWRPGYARQNQVADNYHILEDGEFVYIYETSPSKLQSWPTQQIPFSFSNEVVDSRFLAEIMDELLIAE